MAACARDQYYFPYTPQDDRISNPIETIKLTLERQPPNYNSALQKLEVNYEYIFFVHYETYRAPFREHLSGFYSKKFYYDFVEEVRLCKSRTWCVKLFDPTGRWLYTVYVYQEEDAKKFIDAMALMKNPEYKSKFSKRDRIHENQLNEKAVNYGTAWVAENGIIITCAHIVENSNNINLIMEGGERVKAVILAKDVINDIVLLTVGNDVLLPPGLPMSRINLKEGERVFTIGFPHPTILGTSPKLTDGIISSVRGLFDDPRTYQVSVPVQSGNSGGPLINMEGEVVGVITSTINAVKMFQYTGDLPQNINYAIKSGYIIPLINTISQTKVEHPTLTFRDKNLDKIAEQTKNSIFIVEAINN